ncbi:DUF7344 domain-containing protein [Haloferax litoreum]
MSDETSDKFQSRLYHVLRANRRRQVISILHSTERSVVTVRSVAREIAANEEQTSISHATGEPYRNVYNSLSQTHLPTLQKAGVVIYDSNRQKIFPGPNLDAVALLLDTGTPTLEYFWSELNSYSEEETNDR